MGAFDEYAGTARCPLCGDIHRLSGQTKIFLPEFGELHARYFVPGTPQPVGYPPSEMLAAPTWDDNWWRVRAQPEPGCLAVAVDRDELFACSCGLPLAPVLRFAIDDQSRTVALLEIELLDALASQVAARVDLADAALGVPWKGDYTVFAHDLALLAALSPTERALRLQQALVERFEGPERWHFAAGMKLAWTELSGPIQCEACGTVRERVSDLPLTHPFDNTSVLGEGWRGGRLRTGVRITAPMGWRAADENRGYFLRLRPSVPASTLTLCGGRESWGCGCGAGWASVLARFNVDDDGFTLAWLHRRVVRTLADLDDVDLIYSPACTLMLSAPRSDGRPVERAEVIRQLCRGWNLAE